MTNLLDKLNLGPQERRVVVASMAILFVVLNLWFVWPHFGDLKLARAGQDRAVQKLALYRAELARTNQYNRDLSDLEKGGSDVLSEERAQPNLLMSQIQAKAIQTKLNTGNIRPIPRSRTSTNEYFDEQIFEVGVNPSSDQEIVDFLVAMASSDLLVRIRDLNLKKDTSGTRLTGRIELVASFQKKPPAKTAPVAKTAAPPATKTAVTVTPSTTNRSPEAPKPKPAT